LRSRKSQQPCCRSKNSDDNQKGGLHRLRLEFLVRLVDVSKTAVRVLVFRFHLTRSLQNNALREVKFAIPSQPFPGYGKPVVSHGHVAMQLQLFRY